MNHSLHIGLNRVNPAAYAGWPGLLNACENDAVEFSLLAARLGFTSQVLLNENATSNTICANIGHLSDTVDAGETVMITYSGHGGRVRGPEADGYDETLCFYDRQVVDDEFRAWLALFNPGVNVVVVLDCCHSGGMERAAFRPAVRGLPSRLTQERRARATAPATVRATIALLCACQENQTASDGDKFGAWTGALLATFANQTVQEWFTAAARVCPHGQTPVLRPVGEVGVLQSRLA